MRQTMQQPMQARLVVGITGGIASGKSTVTDLLAQQGICVVDADIAAREVVEPGSSALQQIEQHFGNQVINDDGSLNRSALRAQVFAEPEQRQWLEALLHPLIKKRILEQLKAANSAYTLLSSPLLLETDHKELVEQVIVVDAPESQQMARTQQRDGSSLEQVKAIMDTQLSRQARLQQADHVILNDKDLNALEQQVALVHQKLLQQAQERLTK